MRLDDFEMLSSVLKLNSGLVLTQDKAYLLESRLAPVARRWNLDGLEALVARLRNRAEDALIRDVVEAMTTNESSFFRDTRPFEQFREVTLPQLLASRANRRSIRIWSAACATGQEPYSLAMVLAEESARLAGWRVEIVATDLSTEMVERARAGMFSQFEVQRGLPIRLLMKHFTQVEDRWQISAALRDTIQFRSFNLLRDPGVLGQFDVVFCRNVLIYFDAQTKQRVLEQIGRTMASDATLYLGGAETVLGICDRFRPVAGQRGLYELADRAAAKGLAATGAPLFRKTGS